MHRICIDGLSCGIHGSRARIAIDRTEVVGLNVLLFFIVKLLDLLCMMSCIQRSTVHDHHIRNDNLKGTSERPPRDYSRRRNYINGTINCIGLDFRDMISSSTPIEPLRSYTDIKPSSQLNHPPNPIITSPPPTPQPLPAPLTNCASTDSTRFPSPSKPTP
jgi:hypothetical protein